MAKADNKKPGGIKSFTRAGSVTVRLKAGGKEYTRDTSKERKYKVKGE